MPKDMLLGVCVRVHQIKEQVRGKMIKRMGGLLAVLPGAAFADGDIADMLNSAAEGSKSGMKSALTIAQFVGVLFVIGGFIAAKQKKDNPQIKVSHIIGAVLFGACLIVIPEIIKRAQSQVGLTPVSVG